MLTKNCLVFIIFTISSCTFAQKPENKPELVGPCEGCEGVFEFADNTLNFIDTLPGFENNDTRIRISGTIYEHDGKTPAKGVILYVYHTDQNGIYPTKGDEKGWARRHGYLRGWVKTNEAGEYIFYTLKPGSYPDGSEPAHIHPTILEPNGKYYWLDSYFFKGDPLLSQEEINPKSPRGGSSGLINLVQQDGILTGQRDFILGKNIPEYN